MAKWCGIVCGKKAKPVTILTLNEKKKLVRTASEIQRGDPGTSTLQSQVDWKIEENKKENRTTEYDQHDVIVRRGGKIKLKATFSRELNESGDVLGFELKTGKTPSIKAGTLVRFDCAIDGDLDENTWSGTASSSGTDTEFEINVPPRACIGKYKVRIYIRTVTSSDEISTVYSNQPELYVIANPWSEQGQCYNNSGDFDEFVEEYVMNDAGAIWRGSANSFGPKRWMFGQFEEGVLDVTCKLIAQDKRVASSASGSKLSDLVQIVRILTSVANSCDNNGILMGNWSGEYSDGKAPTSWQSSVAIIEKYIENGYKPVKYGQCWVFSGLLTTLMRTLGIPARSITNFASAHDTDNTMTIDSYINVDGEESGHSDSVWNFHVWNECFLNRGDLPAGYDGWQAVDATPQEDSNGISQCGPSPVKAIKNGETFVNYETNFIFGEVNADRCTWLCDFDEEGNYYVKELAGRSKNSVGLNISTKAPGMHVFTRQDVTHDYKYPEGSLEERKAFDKAFAFTGMTANRTSYMTEFLLGDANEDFVIQISQPGGAITMGDDLKLNVKLINKSGVEVELVQEPSISVTSTYQLGGTSGTIGKRKIGVFSVGNEPLDNEVTFPHEEYKDNLAPDGLGFVRAICVAKVKNGNKIETFCDRFDFQIDVPVDMCKVNMSHTKCRVKDLDVSAQVVFTNKTKYPLSSISVSVEGVGLFKTHTTQTTYVEPGGVFEAFIKFTPEKVGKKTIVAQVDCAQFTGINGSAIIEVIPLID